VRTVLSTGRMSDFACTDSIHIKMEGTLTRTDSKAEAITPQGLCQAYAPTVCRFAALISRSPQDAEDLAQEALLRAVRSLRRYDPSRGPVESWLWRIVANAAIDAASGRQRLSDLVTRIGIVTPSETQTVEDAVITRLRDQELHAQVRQLPLRDRMLIALRYGLDLDLEHVGAAVGLSAESAGTATRRAVARLRARLKESEK
jgi:RNA polymerase sigma-70 factor (ECF subfamily)